MTNEEELLSKFKNGTCSKKELRLIEKWMLMHDEGDSTGLTEDDFEQAGKEIWLRIQAVKNHQQQKISLWPRIAVAASFIVCLSVVTYILMKKPAVLIVKNTAPLREKMGIAPGGNKATLTLANGKTIVLTGAQNGRLATQGNIAITKAADGQIVYHIKEQKEETANSQVAYNTVTTPRGGQYQIYLPDGSHVWLNAASSIKYPTAFTGKTREVELSGEAYFEIAKNPQKPFRVNTGNRQQIEVLGTHFNVEAYADDNHINTTLLEGSVKLIYGQRQAILVPGQIAINDLPESLVVKKANIEAVMAWKNGLFIFNDENIKVVMKKAARWYDFDVEYRGDIQEKKFGGIISRYKSVTELLDNMNISSGIQYKIEGRKIILMN
ncbi:FecR family protein [Mucilaginibacter sp.]|uniref:FecR family protein n=1 Tax=Mucilaginibacter sp. TaxID=1882438 RepID=UPI00263A3C45|nr:FecR family protein [Mucilaginibacter sp.]MDB4923073.1 FecR family protein [Mucilaginibacter sp.]